MHLAATVSLALLALGCARAPAAGTSNLPPTRWPQPVVDSLLRFADEDQSGRAGLAQAITAGDTATLRSSVRADSLRSRWLRRVVGERGWPLRALAGDSAARAAWLILQHSPLHDWQAEMLPLIERLAAVGELPRENFALFADRVFVRRGEPQRYGSRFDVKDGQLVPAPIADIEQLDARRAAVGLPPIEDYIRMIRELYRLPVVWPPP